MLALDDSAWQRLITAYGGGQEAADLLRELEPDASDGERREALMELLLHQGTIYTATLAAVPHLARMAANAADPQVRADLYILCGWMEASREAGANPRDIASSGEFRRKRQPKLEAEIVERIARGYREGLERLGRLGQAGGGAGRVEAADGGEERAGAAHGGAGPDGNGDGGAERARAAEAERGVERAGNACWAEAEDGGARQTEAMDGGEERAGAAEAERDSEGDSDAVYRLAAHEAYAGRTKNARLLFRFPEGEEYAGACPSCQVPWYIWPEDPEEGEESGAPARKEKRSSWIVHAEDPVFVPAQVGGSSRIRPVDEAAGQPELRALAREAARFGVYATADAAASLGGRVVCPACGTDVSVWEALTEDAERSEAGE
ncbi:hypothetical protein [Saccharibacillus brassicae]|uniref:Uncharacterized protein n=1 Tax=Saccharibacillus brassicae TaxID=2583377 RepID=A0A4Y6V106_SACBS|nr:hypothetical protein [Saccharibacillus brassicae]QDH21955.1 hypothetical protein FFV09_14585 [Saccharibacillus brassicae]